MRRGNIAPVVDNLHDSQHVSDVKKNYKGIRIIGQISHRVREQ